MTDYRKNIGSSGEAIAARFLRRQGYRILATNWRCRLGEIDIVARDGDTLVFCEVKLRRTKRFGSPFEAVTVTKQQKLRRLGEYYLAFVYRWPVAARFDVISITATGGDHRIEHLKGAF